MKSRWIVGGGDFAELVAQTWKQARPDENIVRIDVSQHVNHAFDLSALDGLSPSGGAMFVAFDERFGNFKRMELMQAAMARGFKLEPFIHPSAVVGSGAVIGLNVFVGPQVVIGHGSRVDYNNVIHAGAHLGPECRIKSSCWIESGVQLGARVVVGRHSVLRTGAIVKSGVAVGRGCELGWPRLYDQDVADHTTFDLRYDEPIVVHGA